ncbi:MAG TPA: HD domain-containing protein [Candidatus Thermoplasmatota archaeon]|nr:HD domain-containing protein [Candidatus Thermoplasmatota archaeon]
MGTMDELRAGVRRSLPEVEDIADAGLRDKVVEAWAFALSQTEFGSIDEIRASGGPASPPLRQGTQADHLRGVARMAVAMADALERVAGPLGIDRDVLIAGALCHDVGKAFEFSPRNQARWRANPAAAGYPSIRHPVYGVHVALTVGLPEAVAHIAGAHSAEGERVERSLENTIVNIADHAFWTILARAGALAESS